MNISSEYMHTNKIGCKLDANWMQIGCKSNFNKNKSITIK